MRMRYSWLSSGVFPERCALRALRRPSMSWPCTRVIQSSRLPLTASSVSPSIDFHRSEK